MVIALLIVLLISCPLNGMQYEKSTTTYRSPGGFTVTRETGSISFENGISVDDFVDILQEIRNDGDAEHDAVAASDYGKTLLTLLKSDSITEQQIYDHLKAFPHDKIAALKPLQRDVKKFIVPALRKKVIDLVAGKKVDLYKFTIERNKTSGKDLGLINYYNVHAPELLDADIRKKLKRIQDLFSVQPVRMQPGGESSDYFPDGYYKTDRNWLIEIDHEDVQIGQVTEFGTIVDIKPAGTIRIN